MLKQAGVVRQDFKKKKMFTGISVLLKVMLPPKSLTDKTNDPQTRGRTAKLKLEFLRIGRHSHCGVCLSQARFGHSRKDFTIRAF
jgi:hypothetical protein